MSFPPHTFATQGNFLVKPPAGPTVPGSWLDDCFAACAPTINSGNYPTGSVAGAAFAAAAAANGLADFPTLAAPSGAGLIGFVQGVTGAVARTVQDKSRDIVSVKDFGAVGDGSADDTAAFNLAIAYVNASANVSVFCQGTFKITGALTAITSGGSYFVGFSPASFRLNVTASGQLMTWSGATEGGVINCTVTYTGSPAATDTVFTISGSSLQQFLNIDVFNIPCFLQLGTSSGAAAGAINVQNIVGNVANIAVADIRCRWGAGLFIGAWDTSVAGVGVPANNRTSTMTTVAGKSFIAILDGAWDSIQTSPGVQTNRYYHALHVDAPGAVINDIWLGGVFDYNSMEAVLLNSAVAGPGAVLNVTVLPGTWLVSWSADAISVNGPNGNQNHSFAGAIIPIAGKNGVNLQGASTLEICMDHMRIHNVNRIAGTSACINVGTGVTRFTINGGFGRNDTVSGFSWSATNGIMIAADVDDYSITGACYQGTSKNYNFATNSAASGNRLVTNNVFADYAGFQTTGIYVKPGGTGGTFTNLAPTTVEVTATGMNSGISKDATAFAGVTAGTWSVGPGESLSVGYTGSSAMYFDVQA